MGKLRLSTSSSKSYDVAARRAWRMLRLALLWAKKGSILKARLMSELRHGAKYIKRLNHHHHHHHQHDHSSMGMIRYGERELSFDETPVIHLRSSRHSSLRFIMPCIKPDVVDFDYDFGDYGGEEMKKDQCEEQIMDNIINDDEDGEEKEEGIDVKAEEFINKFYLQMKLQREISFSTKTQCHH